MTVFLQTCLEKVLFVPLQDSNALRDPSYSSLTSELDAYTLTLGQLLVHVWQQWSSEIQKSYSDTQQRAFSELQSKFIGTPPLCDAVIQKISETKTGMQLAQLVATIGQVDSVEQLQVTDTYRGLGWTIGRKLYPLILRVNSAVLVYALV